MDGICTMVQEIVSTYSCISEDGKKLFAPEKEAVSYTHLDVYKRQDIDSMKIDAQKKAVREGFDMDIIPTDLATYARCV